jgi:hypothetical protein
LSKKKPNKKLNKTFRVGKYTCTMSFDPETKQQTNVWEPHKPDDFSQRELRDYQEERNAFLEEVGKAIGGKILVVEV